MPPGGHPFARLVCAWIFLGATSGFAQLEPQGLLVYQQPSTTYTEAWEYRSFRHDNALYATVVTVGGDRKQLKAGGVLAVLSYPPPSFGADFESTAHKAMERIDELKRTYPRVRRELETARGKWSRALDVFTQTQRKAAAISSSPGKPAVVSVAGIVFQNARISSASPDRVTLMHASGVTTVPLADLTPAQVLALNRTSDKVQLPLGLGRPVAAPEPGGKTPGPLTFRIGKAGHAVVDSCADKLGVSAASFSAWTFFVVLPVAIVLLLLGWIVSARRKAVVLGKAR